MYNSINSFIVKIKTSYKKNGTEVTWNQSTPLGTPKVFLQWQFLVRSEGVPTEHDKRLVHIN
jgi:hypothetical protein